jgi:hypothetical protein
MAWIPISITPKPKTILELEETFPRLLQWCREYIGPPGMEWYNNTDEPFVFYFQQEAHAILFRLYL